MAERLTHDEEMACIVALSDLLASPSSLDGFDERLRQNEPEMRRTALSAFTKLNRNREARRVTSERGLAGEHTVVRTMDGLRCRCGRTWPCGRADDEVPVA